MLLTDRPEGVEPMNPHKPLKQAGALLALAMSPA